ncbi:MAG: TrbI/VirB10 family protein [Thiobacillaceae bacterium]
MDENQLNAEQDLDITGPNRTEKIIKPEPVHTGRRLNRKTKQYALLGIVVVGGLILAGVALSGHHGKNENGNDAVSNTDLIGQAAPPSPPPVLTSANPPTLGNPSPLAGSGGGTGQTQTMQTTAGKDPLASPSATTSSSEKPLTPAQKYHEWLQDQHYKGLEGQVLATQAAYAAPPGKGDERSGASVSGNVAAGSTPDLLSAALEAAKVGGNVVPQASVAAEKDSSPQGENKRFLDAQKKELDTNGYLTQSLQPPASEHEVFAGSLIPAVLISGINSDLPGEITAQVRQPVYDSLNPRWVLIPQGARLIGQYSSDVAYGQRRVLVAWNRLIYPNGATIALQGMPGTDGLGQAGLGDQVDNHTLRVIGSALLISTLGVAGQLSQPQNTSVLTTPSAGQQAASAAATKLDDVGTQMLQKNLAIQPTLKIRPGYLFNVLVTRTMILPTYPE